MATQEGVTAWKKVLEFFVTRRLKQDLPDAVPLLASSEAAVRKHAVGGMAEAAKRGIDVAAAALALPALLGDADADVRTWAGSALTYHRARALDWSGVDALLASGDARVRGAAADALVRVETADASLVRSLGALLGDGEVEVRKTAAVAIATLARKGVDATSLLPRMIELLADAEPDVRRSAAFAFSLWSKGGFHDYCAPALSALRSASERDENDAVRRFAAQVVAGEAAP
jgi:HEAT repeat protein